ncbi:argininosuccinate lyase [Fictibacillus terranigra]|uniref:Argininosuccinate lyase n=1 Tax=Fictibacillus terranigra TaxID=3058424 RepID=A0ABT8E184_9BACL|nr:argininosuccinate lyase [Fictibacillus sp. CENA-BCM004]MDN4071674.1 argininosuccinate lyase [Fictibacillus sp. CENA-BCM004]
MKTKDEFIRDEGVSFPGKTYEEHLLRHVFNDQRDYLFKEMFAIHRAHVVMLAEQDILGKEEAGAILAGVEKVRKIDYRQLNYDPLFEDLFFMMESRLADEIGADLAGKVHIARSRNDMGVAMYRLVLRRHILTLIQHALLLGGSLLEQAKDHAETVMTAYTHTQPAQPTTLGHYLLAIYDVVNRDVRRLWSAYEGVNRSPLGAAALATTSFPISRDRVRDLLGFGGIVENSYDAIAGGDYLLETASAVMTLMINSGRWIQDLLLQATREFGVIRVADPYVQISSIMPQKRNPVSIEHSRSLASSAAGEALAAIQMIHNTPFGDIVDTEDDLQPHLYRSYEKASRVLQLMHAVIRTMEVDAQKTSKRANQSCITITELSDVLARDKGVPFRKAHQIASAVSKKCTSAGKELNEIPVTEANEWISTVYPASLTEEEWRGIVCPREFVHRRKIQGGPNPEEVKRMISEREEELFMMDQTHQNEKERLRQADQSLDRAVHHFIAGK